MYVCMYVYVWTIDKKIQLLRYNNINMFVFLFVWEPIEWTYPMIELHLIHMKDGHQHIYVYMYVYVSMYKNKTLRGHKYMTKYHNHCLLEHANWNMNICINIWSNQTKNQTWIYICVYMYMYVCIYVKIVVS